MKNIQANTVLRVLPNMIDSLGGTEGLRHDGGSEFANVKVQTKLKQMGVKSIRSYAPLKSSAAERVLQTLKGKLYKFMQRTGSREWYKILPSLVEAYNNTKNRALLGGKLSPNEVNQNNTPDLWFYMKKQQMKHLKPRQPYALEMNQSVRINFVRQPFEKDYLEQNSTVVYFVSFRYRSGANMNRYRLKDELNKTVGGSFTLAQLQKCTVSDQTEYRVEKVLHYKRVHGVPSALVKWFSMPKKYNSYVPVANLRKLQ